ncbi:class I SAM-dependent methyltransferase [Candidatus Saccharibacteria bacterium]|nr:class I SAM-dependent methyltransferase [Candidatus Saccharibacteria bacterium]
MSSLIAFAAGVFSLFALVLLWGAPYLPTLKPQVHAALELLNLKPGQTILELGSGDGKVLLAAAQAGYNVVGIELNPLLAFISWFRTRKYRKQVRVICGNFWTTPWPKADGVFVFLLDRFMPKLDERMLEYKKPLVSVAFQVPGKRLSEERAGVYRYDYS